MTQPWLHIIGIGEDGVDGLAPATRAVLDAAEVIVGGKRHHEMLDTQAERLAWPSPFNRPDFRTGSAARQTRGSAGDGGSFVGSRWARRLAVISIRLRSSSTRRSVPSNWPLRAWVGPWRIWKP